MTKTVEPAALRVLARRSSELVLVRPHPVPTCPYCKQPAMTLFRKCILSRTLWLRAPHAGERWGYRGWRSVLQRLLRWVS